MLKKMKIMVITDRIIIYKDFAINLTHYLFKYYINDGSFTPDDNRNFHRWCFNKVCDEFKEEDIDFSGNVKLEEMFFDYFNKYFFSSIVQDISVFIKFWENFFDVYTQKNINVQSMMLDYYMQFNQSVDESTVVSEDKIKQE